MNSSNFISRAFFLVILGFLCNAAKAQIGGQTVFNGLNIQPAARVAAMGGNFISSKDGDVNLANANPSLIDSSMHGMMALSYVDYFAKTNFGHAAYAHHLKKDLTLAANIQFISHGKMNEYDALGNSIGTFSAGDYMLNVGAGYQYDSLWSIGASFKTLYANIAEYNSLAFAIDAGATYHNPIKNWTISGVIKNLGTQVKTFTADNREKLPFEIQVGISKKPQHAPFRFSLTLENLQQWDLTYEGESGSTTTDPLTGEEVSTRNFEFGDKAMRHAILGVEFLLSEKFQFQMAYNYRRRQELAIENKPGMSGFSFGVFFKVKKIELSYGRAIYNIAGPSNHFTFGYRLNS